MLKLVNLQSEYAFNGKEAIEKIQNNYECIIHLILKILRVSEMQ